MEFKHEYSGGDNTPEDIINNLKQFYIDHKENMDNPKFSLFQFVTLERLINKLDESIKANKKLSDQNKLDKSTQVNKKSICPIGKSKHCPKFSHTEDIKKIILKKTIIYKNNEDCKFKAHETDNYCKGCQ